MEAKVEDGGVAPSSEERRRSLTHPAAPERTSGCFFLPDLGGCPAGSAGQRGDDPSPNQMRRT